MQINVNFNASKGERTFQHVVGQSILDSEDPFDAGCKRAREWCEAHNSRLVSVSFINKFEDSTGQFLGTVTGSARTADEVLGVESSSPQWSSQDGPTDVSCSLERSR